MMSQEINAIAYKMLHFDSRKNYRNIRWIFASTNDKTIGQPAGKRNGLPPALK